jgi:hypothetical protein
MNELSLFPGSRIATAVNSMFQTSISTLVLMLCLFVQPAWGQGDQGTLWNGNFRMRVGDDLQWAQPEWGDADWDIVQVPPDTQAVFWMRTQLELLRPASTFEPKGLSMSILGASALYWDGVLIGKAGTVGHSRETEVPGPIDVTFLIPDSLYTRGSHTLVLRVSSFYTSPQVGDSFFRFNLSDYQTEIGNQKPDVLLSILFLGGFVVLFIYCLVFYIEENEDLSFLLFSLLCISISVLLIAEGWRFAIGYTYDRHFAQLILMVCLTFLTGVLLIFFLLVHFSVPYKRFWVGLMAILLLLSIAIPVDWDQQSMLMFWTLMGGAGLVVGWAGMRRKTGRWPALVGILLCVVGLTYAGERVFEPFFFLVFNGVLFCLPLALYVQLKERRLAAEQAQRQAARLEVDLLKTYIKPHFLENTLSPALEWAEEHPNTGVRLLGALSETFRMLSRISSQTLIPIAEEINLCRSHLRLMQFRGGARFELRVEGIQYEDDVPPALFHALIDQAIAQNDYGAEFIRFTLRGERVPRGRRYILEVPLNEGASGTSIADMEVVSDRLESTFKHRWHLTTNHETDAQITTIELYDA